MDDRDDEQFLLDEISLGSSQYWANEGGNKDLDPYFNKGNEEGNLEGNEEGDEQEQQDNQPARKFVSHSRCIVKDHIPISIQNWKQIVTSLGVHEQSYLPYTKKEILWATMLDTFTVPEEQKEKVKEWTHNKMAKQFQNFKKDW
uniref:Uncharacterized protein n=1 Tax=Oryza punctata TaxID=4537 RepID=A0A0E0MMH3_ORYPU